ncbi:glycoside hydrolase family 78 protein [Yinghuangia sp. ASG 101]|uniref:family 78 glycoside hydrolase catalytic domain n=1 Tax=Yinghuangia sp. ASG 101 TaxID=2896848 RepID=UPI001E3AF883|nr:family 78 glycoside hydrolase catalytic domain [Yinghuangia sp. ASG 101]UGQ10454.1 glycoside hydrolase family 78 protein [Yinghuangia sp. ASG 101]
MSSPTRLRVEHLDEAFGIDVRAPRLSWWLPEGSARQIAYRIRTEDWDSGRVDSDRSVLVPYAGPEASPGQAVVWQVKVWTDLGESEWSPPCAWERVIGSGEWTAEWIEPAEDRRPAPGERPAYLLRRAFDMRELPSQARLYATARGQYEMFVNGERVGDQELTPGFTSYRSRLQVQTYDVTGLLRRGANVVGAVLSDGRFRGCNGTSRTPDGFGTRTALLAQLHTRSQDGRVTVVGTGTEWRSGVGEITAADPMEGQWVDFTRALTGWSEPGFDDAGWAKAAIASGALYEREDRLTTSPAPPVRRIETLPALSVSRPQTGVHVVDFGQNINGWVRLRNLGPRGTELTLVHGEALDADGDVTTDHLDIPAETHDRGIALKAGQRDRVTSSGAGAEVFEPRHTTHGFRYVRIEGHPGAITPGDIDAVVVHTDLRRTGWFRCSDERINRFHEAAVWSFRGNACDIPTDCPTRERDGWTGDWQLFAPTAAFLYDVAGFSTKWLRDLAADQWPDGKVSNVVPDHGIGRRGPEHMRSRNHGSAGWGDAAVIVPWETYLAYDDTRLLAEQYTSMTAWVQWAAERARTGRFPQRAADRPEPAPHEEFVWDAGFHWGEWCEPQQDDTTPFYLRDHGALATAYLHRSAHLLSRIAGILGKTEDAARHRRYADNVLAAWRAEFIGPDGALTVDTQANHVRALVFGLVPDELRARTADRLVALIREAGTHLGTGFLATPHLLPALADAGHLDVAYELLLQDAPPSWLAMTDRGATTVWEEWDGIDDHGVPHASLNHYSKGAVISFLHRHTAGIRLRDDAPGYHHFDIRPQPGGELTWAEAEFDSVHGRIAAHWRIEHGRFHLTATVPPGTTATVTLPNGHTTEAGPGEHHYDCPIV